MTILFSVFILVTFSSDILETDSMKEDVINMLEPQDILTLFCTRRDVFTEKALQELNHRIQEEEIHQFFKIINNKDNFESTEIQNKFTKSLKRYCF